MDPSFRGINILKWKPTNRASEYFFAPQHLKRPSGGTPHVEVLVEMLPHRYFITRTPCEILVNTTILADKLSFT